MRALLLLILFCALGSTSCRVFEPQDQASKVLFVGNSLTYVGNVPAIYAALSAAGGQAESAYMIVRGGATLTQRVADGSVAQALAESKYTTLVLQERGGDLVCSFGPDSCVQSRQAIKHLADLGRQKGVKVVLLGTYQPHPSFSRHLVEKESQAAAEAGIPYIEVSEKLQCLRSTQPQLAWFAPDGMHPGKDLALLNGLLIYQELQGALPAAQSLTVKAPIYGSTSGLSQALRAANAPPPLTDTPLEVHYPAETMAMLLSAVVRASGGYRFIKHPASRQRDLNRVLQPVTNPPVLRNS